MTDLDAARLICVLLQKLESGMEKQKQLVNGKTQLAAKTPWYETRDCPVWPDNLFKYEQTFRLPACPFSKVYINTRYFRKKLAAYERKIIVLPITEIIYEDQITYLDYLNQKKAVLQKNAAIQKRNKEKEQRRLINERNKAIQAKRYQEALKQKNNSLAWYSTQISTFDRGIHAANTMLNILYARYHIDRQVQNNLYALSHIYNYLESGQCHPLTIGMATDKYFEREFRKELLSKVDTIFQAISENTANRAALQRSVNEIKQGNEQVLSALENLNAMSESMGGMLSDVKGTLQDINTMKLGGA